MVVTQDLRSAIARLAMRVDQSLRINLEMGFGVWMDIRSRNRTNDPHSLT